MMTPRELFLELLKPDGQPERQLRQYEALYMCLNDPANTYLRGNRKRGTVSVDRWGTTISFPEDAPGPMPVTEDGLAVCPDVTCWRETVHAPDLAAHCADGWEACRQQARAACGEERLLAGFMGTGIFEQCHFLMGFENTLTGLYEHPQEMHDLIEYILEYRLAYVKLLIDGLHPDVIFSHDDWGTKDALFMKPEMWRGSRTAGSTDTSAPGAASPSTTQTPIWPPSWRIWRRSAFRCGRACCRRTTSPPCSAVCTEGWC